MRVSQSHMRCEPDAWHDISILLDTSVKPYTTQQVRAEEHMEDDSGMHDAYWLITMIGTVLVLQFSSGSLRLSTAREDHGRKFGVANGL